MAEQVRLPFLENERKARLARLLMNFILMQSGFPPVIIPVEERGRYYASLRAANEGDLRPFIRFVAELTDKTLEVSIEKTLKLAIKRYFILYAMILEFHRVLLCVQCE